MPIKDFAIPNNRKGNNYFREPDDIQNRILYGLLLAENISTKELANEIGVSQRSVQRWCFEGLLPNEKNQEKVSKILQCPSWILFREVK